MSIWVGEALTSCTPLLYQSPMGANWLCFSSWGLWCLRVGLFDGSMYQGTDEMYWGIWGLISLVTKYYGQGKSYRIYDDNKMKHIHFFFIKTTVLSMVQCILFKCYFHLLCWTYLPSSSTSAGAFPNFLCSSSSFFFLQSSRVIFFGSSRSTIPSVALTSSVDMILSCTYI